MKGNKSLKKLFTFLLAMQWILTSCTPSSIPKKGSSNLNSETPTTGSSNGGNSGGNGATPGGTDTVIEDTSLPVVEIRNLVEPQIVETNYTSGTGLTGAGSYVRKLTLPKNYSGRLYIGGINVATLADRIVKVRFNFGYNKEPITINATVAKAPGITPQTQIDVLVLDLKNKPFINVRLMYDLYDYKEYGAFTNGIDEEIISSNRDGNLYCRGLRIEDDSTFPGTGACDQADETCLYAYAKVNDKGLTKRNGATYVSTTPTLPQTEIEGNGYSVDSDDYFVKKCLPENAGLIRPNDPITPASEVLTLSGWRANALTIGTQNYVYEGPYKANNVEEWQISGNALLGSKGIFKSFFNGTGLYDSADTFIEQKGEQSYLFPRYTKMELASGVENLSSSGAANASPKSLDSFPSSGSTGWMDGCNKRVQSVNPVGEHIGSCNVTAKIEVLTKDADGVEFIVDDTKDVVLQLVRPTQMSVENGDVLYSNFKSCVNSSQCNQNECCFNQRCWSNSLVTQCLESATNVGNLGNGENCTSDYECSSLCCRNNTCNVHNNMLSPPVLCSKPVGNFCIAREWCQPQPVQNCYVVLTGTSATGQTMCEKRCYMTSELGDCRNGVCIAPPPGATADDFDPEDPDACIDAIPIPNFP